MNYYCSIFISTVTHYRIIFYMKVLVFSTYRVHKFVLFLTIKTQKTCHTYSGAAGFCNHLPKYVLFFVLLLLCGCLCIVIIKEAIIKVIIVIIEII